MDAKGSIMLRVLLNRFHPSDPNKGLEFLPAEEREEIGKYSIGSSDISPATALPSDLLKQIHYSWLIPAIETLPQLLHEAVLDSLPEHVSSKVRPVVYKKFPPQTATERASSPIRTFLIDRLYRMVVPPTVLPKAFLPATSLSKLLDFDKAQLVEVIDFLGLFDLAEGMRYIIDKKQIAKLLACLSPAEQQFVNQCVQQPEKVAATRLKLDQWDGSCEKLETTLHSRGILRLGKALSGQNKDFLWHLSHILDIGRGQILMKHSATKNPPGVTSALIQQVNNVLNFLKQKKMA